VRKTWEGVSGGKEKAPTIFCHPQPRPCILISYFLGHVFCLHPLCWARSFWPTLISTTTITWSAQTGPSVDIFVHGAQCFLGKEVQCSAWLKCPCLTARLLGDKEAMLGVCLQVEEEYGFGDKNSEDDVPLEGEEPGFEAGEAGNAEAPLPPSDILPPENPSSAMPLAGILCMPCLLRVCQRMSLLSVDLLRKASVWMRMFKAPSH
jgi:hypothetical protein